MGITSNNHLFELARVGARRFSPRFDKIYPILALIYALVAPLVSSAIVSIPLAVYFILTGKGRLEATSTLSSAVGLTTLLILGFSPIFFLVWVWLRLFERRSLWTSGMERQQWLVKYLRGALLGLMMIGVAVGLPAAFGHIRMEGNIPGIEAAIAGVLLLLVGWVVQGAAEELLFRGFLFPIFGARYGLISGVLVSSVLFALLHVFNANLSLLAMCNLALFGVFSALYAAREGGLWGVFAIHSLWNWTQGNLFGMEVSGLPVQIDAVFKLKEVGPDWFTGGAFGPEGGIAVSLVLIAGIFVLWLPKRTSRSRASTAGSG
jgi:membrane protease YdiL (CAAX protease family)